MPVVRSCLLAVPLAAVLASCGGGGAPSATAPRDQQVAAAGATTNTADLMRAVNSPCQWYGALDGSGDGAIDQYEYGNFSRVQFERWDLDGNDAVSKTEFDRCVADGSYTRLTGTFDAFDRDGNGALADGEFFAGETYGRMDANGDGRLQSDEWRSVA